MAILAYPLCVIYLAIFFFFPEIAAIILLALATLLWLYILVITKGAKSRVGIWVKDKDFSEKEQGLLYKYPAFFRYPFVSTTISEFLSVVQISTIIMAIILLFKQLWLYLIPIAIVFLIFASLRPKLDPLFFLKQLYAKQKDPLRQMEVKTDIDFMGIVYDKFWGIGKEERAEIDRAHKKGENI